MTPVLATPANVFRTSFLTALAEYAPTETDLSYERTWASHDLDRYVQGCAAWSRGEDLPEGWVPSSTFWLVDRAQYLGTVLLRHFITEHMHRFGGHIGYIIRPSERRKGYGSLICKLTLDEARSPHMRRHNVGSAKSIERNGGVLQDKIAVGTRPVPTRRYWIELT